MTRAAAFAIVLVVACGRAPDEPAPLPHATTHELAHARSAAAVRTRARPATVAHVTIKALGMYCEESCPLAVRTALAGVPAVYELGFDLTKESVFVSYDASLGAARDVTKPMLAAIKRAGFDPWLAKEEWPAGVVAAVVGER